MRQRQNNREIPREIQDVGAAEKKTNSDLSAGCAASQVFCSFIKVRFLPLWTRALPATPHYWKTKGSGFSFNLAPASTLMKKDEVQKNQQKV